MSSAITFLGFGEAAQAFAGDQRWQGAARGYDVKTDSPALAAAKAEDFDRLRVRVCASAREALRDAGVVLSLVTADEAAPAAENAAAHIAPDALYFDMNSVAPATKRAAAAAIEGGGGLYVDVAIMSPVKPAALDAPLFLSGPHAETGALALSAVGFTSIRAVGPEIGSASLIKMVRSVMIKGVEAVTAECLLAAQAGGVVDEVIASLCESSGAQINYNLERVLVHGLRRAAEMREVAKTLLDLGVEPRMTQSAIAWQRELGALDIGSAPSSITAKLAAIEAVRRPEVT
jgi:3-hydroxyisobutyrate dehydrogenase-like beta-hydroxyacid dehydrogenase